MHIETVRLRSLATRSSRRAHLLPVATVFALVLSGNAWADEYLDPIGGPGGGRFEAHCPADQYLAGFQLRAGDDVDAIRPLCVVAHGPREVGPAASEDNWYGGTGGGPGSVACTTYKPVVTGMFVSAEGEATVVVNNIHLFCGLATDTREASDSPSALFDAPKYDAGSLNGFIGGDKGTQHCPAGQVAVGVHGRSGIWVDAIGLICGDAPRTVAVPQPQKIRINPSSMTLKPTGIVSSAASSGTSTTAPKSSGSVGSAGPVGTAGIPATVPPSVPSPPVPPTTPAPPSPPQPDSKQAVRNAALQSLVEAVVSTMQRPPRTGDTHRRRGPANMPGSPQPEDSIHVEVRYPTFYGYQNANGANPYSCGAFYLSAISDAGTGAREAIRIDAGERMRSGDGMYICDYLMPAMPRNTPIAVRVAMSDMRAAGQERWLAGTQTQPPAGQRRTIVPADQQVLLTANRPRASLRFEMVYSGAR